MVNESSFIFFNEDILLQPQKMLHVAQNGAH